MTDSPTSTIPRPTLRERLGIPDIAGHRRFVVAIAVDAVGSGVFMPLAVLYFVTTTSVPLAYVGLAMSVAGAVAFPFVLVVGHLVDRLGAEHILLAANLAQAAAYVGFVLADDFPAVLGVLILASLGQSAFWASYSPTVAAVSRPGERELWFGFLGALRNVGFAVGGLAAGAAVAIGTTTAFDAAVLANAASYLLAFVLLLRVTVPAASATDGDPADHGGWRRVLGDRDYALVVLANLSYALASMALNVAMPVYVAQTVHLPGWLVGALYVVNTVLVGFAQSLIVRGMTGHRRWRLFALGQAFFAAGFVGLAAVSALSVEVAVAGVLLAVAVYTLGEIFGGPVLSAIAVESSPEELRGRYMSVFQLSWTASGVIAPAVFTKLLDHGPLDVWWVLITLTAAGAGLAPIMARRLPVAAARVTNAAVGAA